MEPQDLVDLVNLVCSKDISEFELEREGFRLRIRRAGPATSSSEPQAGSPIIAVERVAASAPVEESAVEEEGDDGLFVARSPIVGTFFRAPNTGAEPYVKVGDRVKQGQVLCIVEAMKLMNEIESEAAGVVGEVLVENGQPVEFGEPLFKIRPDD